MEPYVELNAEDQSKVLRAFQQACEQAVSRYEGSIVQCDERGLLACFGYPIAAHQTSLALNRLTRDQAKEMIQKKAGSALPEAAIDQVYQRAGGVPPFIEEFTKIPQKPGTATTDQADGGAGPSHEIPDSLQDLIMARVDRMEGDREIAQLAVVLGREFNHELLTAVAKLDPPALNAEMRQLVQTEIIYQRGRPHNCVYIFKHALLQDALYNSMLKSKRQQLHRRVGEVIEAEFGLLLIETRPELLAHHFSEAGLPEKAIRYWLQAGLRSRERSAEVEAIGHLTRGVALIEGLAESPERDALELELLGPLGTAYIATRGYAAPEVGPTFQRARELCERVGQPPQLFAMMLGIWEWHTVRADLRKCVDLAEEGMEFASRLNDPGMLMEGLFMAGETMLYRGDFADARECFATATADYDDRERTKFWPASGNGRAAAMRPTAFSRIYTEATRRASPPPISWKRRRYWKAFADEGKRLAITCVKAR